MLRVLLLGGTTEASQMAKALHCAGIKTVFSYAGRTKEPVPQPVPTRIGGFGGVEGLCSYMEAAGISHVIDATHPFAATISRNAHTACSTLRVSLIRLERPLWISQPDDNWQFFPDIQTIADHLPDTPARVFLAIGKQHIEVFAAAPQHYYLLRLVDAPDGPMPLPHHTTVRDRGPFTYDGDLALMQAHSISYIVAKNSGGTGARAKLDAARALQLPVLLADRPALPETAVAGDPYAVLRWLGHSALRGV
jgi:precorrin-6A/cobalt-precorrin-6A reductase